MRKIGSILGMAMAIARTGYAQVPISKNKALKNRYVSTDGSKPTKRRSKVKASRKCNLRRLKRK